MKKLKLHAGGLCCHCSMKRGLLLPPRALKSSGEDLWSATSKHGPQRKPRCGKLLQLVLFSLTMASATGRPAGSGLRQQPIPGHFTLVALFLHLGYQEIRTIPLLVSTSQKLLVCLQLTLPYAACPRTASEVSGSTSSSDLRAFSSLTSPSLPPSLYISLVPTPPMIRFMHSTPPHSWFHLLGGNGHVTCHSGPKGKRGY